MVEGKASTNFIRGILYLLPALVLLGIFTFYPLVNTFIISFKEGYDYMTGSYEGFGLGNYQLIFHPKNPFTTYLFNTMIIVFISVPISIILSLLIAVSLNSVKSLQKFFQTIFFLPYVTNTIAIGMVFSVMFESNQGLINTIINFFGGKGINWLGGNNDNALLFEFAKNNKVFNSQYWTSLVVLLVYITWNSLPFKILILLSALQSVDKQYYQAAQIDGTSKLRTFTKITVPLLSPQIFYLLITSYIGAFKEYTSVVAIFGKNASSVGARNNMATVVWYIYNKLKEGGDAGAASAGAVVLFVIIMIFTAINKYVSSKKVFY
ncbi:MAG: carbohydrate ABC transporter permease [Bacilli bacterium]